MLVRVTSFYVKPNPTIISLYLSIDVNFRNAFFVWYIYKMLRQSAAGYNISKVQFNYCSICHYWEKKYFVRTIGNHWRYCKAYKNKFLGDNETKKLEQDKKRRVQRTKRFQQRNHGNNQRRLFGYKAELLKSNPEPTLEYSVANAVTNGWMNIEDDEHPFYWVKVKSSLSALVCNKKLHNQLILCLQGQVSTWNLISKIVKLKELWTEKNWSPFSFSSPRSTL